MIWLILFLLLGLGVLAMGSWKSQDVKFLKETPKGRQTVLVPLKVTPKPVRQKRPPYQRDLSQDPWRQVPEDVQYTKSPVYLEVKEAVAEKPEPKPLLDPQKGFIDVLWNWVAAG